MSLDVLTCSPQLSREVIKQKHHSRLRDFFVRRLDIIIFGATGCAGRFTVMEAVRVLRPHSWGVAGRNKIKMREMLQDIGIQHRKSLSRIPIIFANMKQKRTVYNLAKRCRVLVNCSGPYESYAENIIKACISVKTHYIDLCTESHFMDYIYYRFDDQAKRKGVYIIMGCGLQSLPADVGVNYMSSNFNGTINSIHAYVEFWTKNPFVIGSVANKNVWASFVVGNRNMKKFRRRLLPRLEPVSARKPILGTSDVVKGFCIPAPTVDEDIVDRTQQYFMEEKNRRPIQYHNYFAFTNPAIALLLLCWYFLILLLSQFRWTRNLLLKFPRIFSFGLFSSRGPDSENVDDTFFQITFKAEGWSKTTRFVRHAFSEPPNRVVVGKVSGTCPFYGVACVCLLVGATTILNEQSRLPHRGGVYTPGAAFENTGIINELEKYDHGLSFEIISSETTS